MSNDTLTIENEDRQARQQAIDPYGSYIVQAPAGSGKTELLSQRYLCLLAKAVNSPEEIIAITFTRKAAAEMRERIVAALEFAHSSPEPKESYKKLTWRLAKQVLDVDSKNNWHLLANPNRLRILTIDSLSAMISAQTPLLSRFGVKPSISEDIGRYYELAIEEFMTTIDEESAWSQAIKTLLLHLDNNAMQLSRLLIHLLARRDQWLSHIVLHGNDITSLKIHLENALENIVAETLAAAENAIPTDITYELQELAQFAGKNVAQSNKNHPISRLQYLDAFPAGELEYFDDWLAMANLLLTTQNEWRKIIDKRSGFPADQKDYKARMLTLLGELQENDHLKNTLSDIRLCPPLSFSEQQWTIIQALIQLLPVLVAQLTIIFRRYGIIDFTELTLGALRALGDEGEPTDIALYLDYQIRHLLVDEFQDTSVMQFNLLQQLVAEWQPNDGRSLFLVGDPMQSIYRFRNAEVGLFLRAQQQGIANIPLKPLILSLNFRSQDNIVSWINQTFSVVFPAHTDISSGAVPYSQAIATHDSTFENSVYYYSALKDNPILLAEKVVAIIEEYHSGSIAILVRSRSQLSDIIPALHLARIRFNAIEIESLAHRMEILDLISLTRAMLHIGDRIAWLAVLRSPCCGLTLHDLHALAQAADQQPLWSVIATARPIPQLSDDGQKRLNRIRAIFTASFNQQGRSALSEWIKGTWLSLAGPAFLTEASQLNNTQAFFNLLESIEGEFSLELLQSKLDQLYAESEISADTRLQIMTIHKSKGLEFDHVILPELQKQNPSEANHLLMWLERINAQGNTDLILAPIKSARELDDPIHTYLKQVEVGKLHHESKRLFYVAATRAKQTLHLLSLIDFDEKKNAFKKPSKSSFIAMIWDLYQEQFTNNIIKDNSETDSQNFISVQSLQSLTRIKSEWKNPLALLESAMAYERSDKNQPALTLSTAAKQIGTVIHESLQHLATNTKELSLLIPHWRRRLQQLGLQDTLLDKACEKVKTTIENTLSDKTGQWILSKHRDAHCEYAVTVLLNNKPARCIIDRTFIDEHGTRWIIDYKTSTPQDEDLASFIKKEKESYQQQLERYGCAFSSTEDHPIKLALYFPACLQFVAWDFVYAGDVSLAHNI